MSGDLGFGGGIYGTFLYQQVICDVDLDCILHGGINHKRRLTNARQSLLSEMIISCCSSVSE